MKLVAIDEAARFRRLRNLMRASQRWDVASDEARKAGYHDHARKFQAKADRARLIAKLHGQRSPTNKNKAGRKLGFAATDSGASFSPVSSTLDSIRVAARRGRPDKVDGRQLIRATKLASARIEGGLKSRRKLG